MALKIIKKANDTEKSGSEIAHEKSNENQKIAVITILGIQGGNIDDKNSHAEYFLGGENAKFINTLPLLATKFGSENIFPIYTNSAREFNEKVIRLYPNLSVKFNDEYEIKSEQDFEAIFALFEKIRSDLNALCFDKIIFDVTHGFRHLPLLALVDLLIQNFSSTSKIDQILFAKEIVPRKKYEIIDLKEYLDIANIAFLLTSFSQNYTLTSHIKVDKFNSLINALNSFSNNILSLNIAKLKSSHENLINELETLSNPMLKTRANNLINKLKNLCDWNKKPYQIRHDLANDMLNKGYLLQSLVLLFESVNGYITDIFKENLPKFFDELQNFCSEQRERKNYLINNFFMQVLKIRDNTDYDTFRKKSLKNLKDFELSNKQINDLKSVLSHKFQNKFELIGFHEELDKKRNDFAHGNISEKEFDSIKQKIKELFHIYEKLIKI